MSIARCTWLILALLVSGCERTAAPVQASTNSVAVTNAPVGRPQPKLSTVKLWLGAQELVAEVARRSNEVATGMMFRESMAETEGMLFVFQTPHRASFWMKNTLVPLSCAYIDSEGTILEIYDMKPKDETSIEARSDRIQYVLEVNQGWFQRNNVGVGVVMRTDRGSLRETFFRQQ